VAALAAVEDVTPPAMTALVDRRATRPTSRSRWCAWPRPTPPTYGRCARRVCTRSSGCPV